MTKFHFFSQVLTEQALACTVVYLFRSGAVAAFLLALLTACMPLFIMLIGFWILFQSVFPNRRRRR